MRSVRRFATAAFVIACLHLVFGAIVRISGSGMGCGDHWPKCYGQWIPPMNRPDLIVEVSHRYLASILLLSLIATVVAAWRRRSEPLIGGRGGVMRMAGLAVVLGFSAALLGAVTVKLGNAPFATLAHWTVAMSLVAATVATLVRAGGLGGTVARIGGVSARTKRGAFVGAAMALLTVVMGGLTAKFPGAAVACRDFPLCGRNPDVVAGAVHVQLTHRVLAVLVVLHLIGLAIGIYKRNEASLVRRAVAIAAALGLVQLGVAAAMVLGSLPPVLRSLHEATGVSIWIATFALAYLARIASGGSSVALTGDIEPLVGGTRSASRAQAHASGAVGSPRGAEG
ncbi:MAG: COX15/CtaA family protein [bacterium]